MEPTPSEVLEQAQPNPAKPSESGCLYILGGISFIPLIGVPFGLFSVIAGLVTWKRGGWKLALIGIGGVIFTVVLYSSLFYFGFVQRGGIYDGLRARLAQQQLNDLVKPLSCITRSTTPIQRNWQIWNHSW